MQALQKLKDAAAKVFGLTDWVADLEPVAPVVDTPTIAVTHAYRNDGSTDPLFTGEGYERLEWLELRKNDSAQPCLTSEKPVFAFFGDYQAICRDGTKFPMAMLNMVKAPAELDPAKYTLFRREVRAKDPTTGAYFFLDVPHSEAVYKTTVERKNIDLEEAMAAMTRFERAQGSLWPVVDTAKPGNKHFSAQTVSIPAPANAPA